MRRIKKYYDALAESYDRVFESQMRIAERKVIERIKEYKKAGSVLDLGCGTGYHFESLSKYGKVYGLDISPKLIYIAKKKNNLLVVADAQYLPFKDESFDIVVSIFGALNHVKNIDKTLFEIKRVLKREGVFLFTVANAFNMFWHLKMLKRLKIRKILNALRKRKGYIVRKIGKKRYKLWTRFYSIWEIKKILCKHFEIRETFGINKSKKVYRNFAFICEYIGAICIKRVEK